jgi:hypothetical protein
MEFSVPVLTAGALPLSYRGAVSFVNGEPDNAAPEAEAVYGALGMPFSALVFGLRQYYSQASVDARKKVGA